MFLPSACPDCYQVSFYVQGWMSGEGQHQPHLSLLSEKPSPYKKSFSTLAPKRFGPELATWAHPSNCKRGKEIKCLAKGRWIAIFCLN